LSHAIRSAHPQSSERPAKPASVTIAFTGRAPAIAQVLVFQSVVAGS